MSFQYKFINGSPIGAYIQLKIHGNKLTIQLIMATGLTFLKIEAERFLKLPPLLP
jgi:hypothetical protein